ncbi:hypothetical protein SKTS_17530 [Sulfurimicrobium lacus]|uniref:Tetratricopeptide repeat protein n=1 Tax=Sulfurimicrobium lacus TaxID=2715678 RepID=A0A6F8VCN2_9PROT|nr:hypothetical protein [Sulfurimicrobium lacus]BCB26867.1 hypothetical protein SKTS_17530 [Sulfurimicrobium lacus]
MNHLDKTISILTLPGLAFLSGRAAAASEYAGLLDDFFHFDASSLIWMLIGGAIVTTGVILRSRGAREADPSMRKPALQMPSEAKPATNGETRGGNNDVARTAQYWLDLDEATTVTVEEMSCIEEEAEVFLMMGRPDMAIKLLRDYLEAEPDCKANAWFKLLDIYHVQELREPFNHLAKEIKTRFNVALPTWEANRAVAQLRYGLEHFPNLLSKISQHWNDPSGLEILHELMRENRQGERMGFHEEAFRDMLLLSDVLEARMAESAAQADSPDD